MKQKLLLFFITIFFTMIASAQCDIVTPNYYEDFSVIPNECWEEADSGDAESGPMDIGSGSWGSEGFLNNGLSGAYRINLYLANKSDWLLSPEFDLSGGPFQVDFDFGIMAWDSSTTAGTLGSDDTVQLLLTNDGGTTWIPLLTYDENSEVSVEGEHPIIDLTAYSGETVQFGILASEGEIDDIEDVEVFVDNFRVRNLITCFEPIALNANNLNFTSADISWEEQGTATSWNIEYGVAGFTLGTGTMINGLTETFYSVTDLTNNTEYDYYVQSVCGEENSNFAGPFTFATALQTNFDIDCVGDGSLTQDYCYGDGGATDPIILTYTSADGTPLNLTFNSGSVETAWDELVVLDSNGVPFPGYAAEDENYGNGGDIGGLTFQSTGDSISFYINSDASWSCQSSNSSVSQGINYTVSCATCINPAVTFEVVNDCENGDQFLIDVDVTSLGDATSLTISNNNNEETTSVTATGVYQIGPFPFLVDVIVTVDNDQDETCSVNSSIIQVLGCPPSNDECDAAIVVPVNSGISCDVLTSGTINLATDSGVSNYNCPGVPNDDVWFSFTALSEIQNILIQNIAGGTYNLNLTLFEGTCGALTELSCSESTSIVAQNLIIGNTYYVRVFSADMVSETSTFELCIKEAVANTVCESAVAFCSNGNEITTPNITGVPSSYSMSCLASAPNPSWNILQIDDDGAIEIEISQLSTEGTNLDVDFVLFGPFDSVDYACDEIVEGCTSCQNIIDCSYSVSSVENFTITNALSDEIYILLTTNYSDQEGTTYISQTNFGQPDSGSLKADFEIDLGTDQNLCGVNAYQLDATTQFGNSYQWYSDGFLIPEETNARLTVTESGTYSVVVNNDLCSSSSTDDIIITFNNCDDVGLINVSAFYDDNENTVFDSNETHYANGYFTYEANNDGIINAVASSTGNFTIASYDDTDTIDINYYFYDEYSDCYDVSIASFQDITVLNGEDIAVEFPIVDEQSCEDISVYLINEQSPRPGFGHTNYLIIQNLGLTPTSGTINYSLDSNLSISNISTNSNYTTTLNADGFSLDFVNLLPQQTIIVNVNLQTATSANLGDLVTTTATYTTSSNDIVSENNESSVTEEIIGSYDPNDKMESHGKDILYDDFVTSDEYLYYTIRFQNVGTAEAITVRIEDVLDTQLDESTFHMLRSSHNYVVTRTDRNLEWNFDNINLPAEQDDEAGSNGYVYFKIKPNTGYAIGDVIENTAAIYFDFNEPIITNTFQTEFVETLSVNGFDSNSFSLFPNPAKENVTIQLASSNFETGSVNIYNIQGKAILKPVNFEGNSSILDISSLESGLYFVTLTVENSVMIQKLIVD
ncbi:T9SS type A sorting domain-containing protein [Winogradskyella undariae]|uniref:T9SS type A sorting domain-containing protein n=1 Tax=Winogradskyella undariae TaxID=1285465 RepID=UPI00156A93D9|nr:T9SS type A sorting domain-containing protein [Winogradskyella undariae]NRR91887.1 T9SS type A sorting domain-containing protein [Winogradskyella undariae]